VLNAMIAGYSVLKLGDTSTMESPGALESFPAEAERI
jgi:hypothetical protein